MATWNDFYINKDFDSLDFDEEEEIPDTPDLEVEDDELFCQCKMPETGEMIECAGTTCPGRNWFHFGCTGMTPDEVPDGDWLCKSVGRANTGSGKLKFQWFFCVSPQDVILRSCVIFSPFLIPLMYQ